MSKRCPDTIDWVEQLSGVEKENSMKKKKVYSYSMAQQVIDNAFRKAIKHCEKHLRDQFDSNGAYFSEARCEFFELIEQNTEFLLVCDECGETDLEGNCTETPDGVKCYKCEYEK